jgi:TonB-dependent SusC/RagA subfamily outer membrane receptor
MRASAILAVSALLLCPPVTGSSVVAQEEQKKGAVTGTIFDQASGAPLMGVRVSIVGTKLRAQTDSSGSFRLNEVPPGEANLRIERTGYNRLVENILVHSGWTTGVELELIPIAVLLDALQIRTGARVTGARREEIRPEVNGVPRSPTEALAAKAPGVLVMRPSGEIGRGTRILIRGPSSISLPNQPVVYLDGVRVNANMVGMRNDGYLNLDFVSSESIDRIEVLRGPSAAAQYGGDASGGVILIYTKR